MKATYIQKGEAIDYLNAGSAVIEAGAVVSLGTRIGIAGSDIAPGQTGALHVTGVFELLKDGSAIALGSAVYYDAANDCVTSQAEGNVPAGWAVAPAGASDPACRVKLLG